MTKKMLNGKTVAVLLACAILQQPAPLRATGNAEALEKIAASSKSGRAVEYLDRLVNGIGARHAGTAADYAACEWALAQFENIGLRNVHAELCAFQPSFAPSDTGETRNKPVRNVVADIIGVELPDEYVIIGAHLDSTGPGRGAEDNGSGVAAVMEAARLIMKSGAKPRRTIRFILFAGEEAMLLGSRSYVMDHGDILPKISAMFNMDEGGRNPVSGIKVAASMKGPFSALEERIASMKPGFDFTLHLVDSLSQGARVECGGTGTGKNGSSPAQPGEASNPGGPAVESPSPIQAQPGGMTLEIRKCFGTSDHAAFLEAGIPAFMFLQKGPEPYHGHSGNDNFDVVIPEVLQHAAAAMAVTALTVSDMDCMVDRRNVGTISGEFEGCGIGK